MCFPVFPMKSHFFEFQIPTLRKLICQLLFKSHFFTVLNYVSLYFQYKISNSNPAQTNLNFLLKPHFFNFFEFHVFPENAPFAHIALFCHISAAQDKIYPWIPEFWKVLQIFCIKLYLQLRIDWVEDDQGGGMTGRSV